MKLVAAVVQVGPLTSLVLAASFNLRSEGVTREEWFCCNIRLWARSTLDIFARTIVVFQGYDVMGDECAKRW